MRKMVTISHNRRCPWWRMLFSFVIFYGLIEHGELIPTKKLSDSSSSSSSSSASSRSSSEARSQNLGSPSDLAWQAWLLLDSQTGAHSSFESANFLRRIKPKSVFIAPELPALPPCADGYRADTMGRCIKSVNIDNDAHLSFLLERLNNKFGNRNGNSGTSESSNNSRKKSSGPFQLNIPLLSDSGIQSMKIDHETTKGSIKIPIIVSSQDIVHSSEESDKDTEVLKSIDATQQVENRTAVLEDVTTFSSGNSNPSPANKYNQSNPSKIDMVIPVAEFVDDVNETSYSEVVDYKIPKNVEVSQQVENRTAVLEGVTTFFSGNSNPSPANKYNQSIPSKIDMVIPVAEFVDEVNETSYSEVVDYKIPKSVDATEQVENRTAVLEEVTTFFSGNSNPSPANKYNQSIPSKIDMVIPAAEYIDDVNETSYSEVVDYIIPESVDATEQVENRTAVLEEETTFSSGNSNPSPANKYNQSTPSKIDMVIPAAEFVDDVNETSYSEVVDYKIPKTSNVSDEQDTWENATEENDVTFFKGHIFYGFL